MNYIHITECDDDRFPNNYSYILQNITHTLYTDIL